jgi:cytidine deaminase
MASQESLQQVPELVIGIVAPIGTDTTKLKEALVRSLTHMSYACEEVKLSDGLKTVGNPKWRTLPEAPIDDRYHAYMTAGNDFRKAITSGSAMALLAVGKIRDSRQKKTGKPNQPLTKHAFILSSLKHPDEVAVLRRIYGSAFVLVAATAPRERRVQYLSRRIANSRHKTRGDGYRAEAEKLMNRDEDEALQEYGQKVQDTFPMADVFFDVRDNDQLFKSVDRFVQLLFGHPYHTPTRDEYGMFHAQAAALRSAALGRQVGAAITTDDGNVIAVGTNEVPKPGGGLYWPGDCPDHRDFQLGSDSNDELKLVTFAGVLSRLLEEGLISANAKFDAEKVAQQVIKDGPKILKGTQLNSILEFSRCVHAEMAAVCDAARRGVAVENATLYSTTFPCHGCAKHVVAAGILRVVYIEPYPKSLVLELFSDSISIDSDSDCSNKVRFQSFFGIAPRQFMHLFQVGDLPRKTAGGKVVDWPPPSPTLKLSDRFPSIDGEDIEFHAFKARLETWRSPTGRRTVRRTNRP